MTDNPYTAPDSSYAEYNAQYAQALPGLAKAFAIIAICLGALNIMGGVCGTIALGAMTAVFTSPQIQQALEKDDSANARQFRRQMQQMQRSMPLYIAQGLASFAVSVGLLTGGIGSLKQREWARKTLVVSCVLYLLLMIVGWIASIYMAFGQNDFTPEEKTGAIVGVVLGGVFGIIFAAFYAFMAYYFTRSNVRQAFMP